jgi:hypothetical protein
LPKPKPLPPVEVVKSRFDYDHSAGRLVYKVPPHRNQPYRVGQYAGSRHCEGGWAVSINNSTYLHCRIVWLYVHGQDPGIYEIDHIDCDRSNDRIENLRLADRYQQAANTKVSSKNTSGYKGVSYYKRLNLWQAYITKNNKFISLGYHKTKEDAAMAYKQAALELFGEYAKFQ